ncbi:cysteine-rich CWC family protein [Shewanella sp. TC10]|uniref:cysteine-rich CWC family protein n=1 Tax=Shewanella sp. TC10 TaxID=1419739 RepID=UPI00129E8D13|nr:cysteine-rich CWC family protein [Shewanella sp. TC10]
MTKKEVVQVYRHLESENKQQVAEPLTCPVCLKENKCAVTAGLSIESCWCLTQSGKAKIDPKLLAGLNGKACICQSCYQKLTQ